MRKKKNKNYSFVPSLPDAELKIPNKFKKLKNASMASFKGRIGWKRRERKKINIVVPFRSYPTRNRKLQKNSKNIQKN